jgi:hypothetical protein
MSTSGSTAMGIYGSREAMESGILALKNAGFGDEDISVLYPGDLASPDAAQETSSGIQLGAVVGGTSGVAAGATLGLLAGLVAMAIPGVGPFLAAGPILGALAGAGVGGVVGEVAGALVAMGASKESAERYQDRLSRGGMLVSVQVHPAGRANGASTLQKAIQTLRDTGAEDVTETSGVGALAEKFGSSKLSA